MQSAQRKLTISETPKAKVAANPTLISKPIDAFMIGGLSLLLFAFMSVMVKYESPPAAILTLVFNLSFFVNFPHFLASYQLLYVDFRSKIFREPAFFWAGVAVPLFLVLLLVSAFAKKEVFLLANIAKTMYFFVGWHYVKQIFGGVIVTNALKNYFYNSIERFFLKANLFSLWAISFLVYNVGDYKYNLNGISYSSMNLPNWTFKVAYTFLILSGIGVLYTHLAKYIREGHWPNLTAFICFASIYAWYLPAMSHPMFFHIIPFFHCLQYLLFVYAFRRNKVASSIKNLNTPESRKKWLKNLYGYLLIPVITGAIFMHFLPKYIDSLGLYNVEIFGTMAAYFSFYVFINIHHYFIDSVIWRGSNKEVREHLYR